MVDGRNLAPPNVAYYPNNCSTRGILGAARFPRYTIFIDFGTQCRYKLTGLEPHPDPWEDLGIRSPI